MAPSQAPHARLSTGWIITNIVFIVEAMAATGIAIYLPSWIHRDKRFPAEPVVTDYHIGLLSACFTYPSNATFMQDEECYWFHHSNDITNVTSGAMLSSSLCELYDTDALAVIGVNSTGRFANKMQYMCSARGTALFASHIGALVLMGLALVCVVLHCVPRFPFEVWSKFESAAWILSLMSVWTMFVLLMVWRSVVDSDSISSTNVDSCWWWFLAALFMLAAPVGSLQVSDERRNANRPPEHIPSPRLECV